MSWSRGPYITNKETRPIFSTSGPNNVCEYVIYYFIFLHSKKKIDMCKRKLKPQLDRDQLKNAARLSGVLGMHSKVLGTSLLRFQFLRSSEEFWGTFKHLSTIQQKINKNDTYLSRWTGQATGWSERFGWKNLEHSIIIGEFGMHHTSYFGPRKSDSYRIK